ncbi:MAG: glycosyltransferase family 2 protein [bacterium]
MNNNKLVSIAMATYNGEKFLHEQLDSIYNQTYKNIEIVATDDCSNDNTVKILEEYKKKYGLKYYINEKRLGFKRNFERAVSLCRGKYIAFSDQDDIWASEKIETMINKINGNSLIHSDGFIINENNKIIADSMKEYLDLDTDMRKIESKSNIWGCTILFKSEILEKALPIPDREGYDWWFSIVASKMNGVKYLEDKLIMYRKHQNNATSRSQLRLTLTEIYKMTVRPIYMKLRTIRRYRILRQRGL